MPDAHCNPPPIHLPTLEYICCGRTPVSVHWVHVIPGRITASVPRGKKYVHAKMGLVDTAHRYVPRQQVNSTH